MMSSVDKRIKEGIKREGGGELFNEASNVPFFGVVHLHHQRSPLLIGSPLSGVSLQSSEYSPSSSFSNGFSSSEDDLTNATPAAEEAKDHQTPTPHFLYGPYLDSTSPHHVVDELGLSRSFHRMNVRDAPNGIKMKGFEMEQDPEDVLGLRTGNRCFGDSVQCSNVKKYSLCDDVTNRGCYDIRGFQSSPHGTTLCSDGDVKCTFNGLQGGFCNSTGYFLTPNQSNDLCSGSDWSRNQRYTLLEQSRRLADRGIQLQKPSCTRPNFDDNTLPCLQKYRLETDGSVDVLDPLVPSQLMQLDMNYQNTLYNSLMLKQRTTATNKNGVPPSLVSHKGAGEIEGFSYNEDDFILHRKGLSHVGNKRQDLLRGHKKNSSDEISAEKLQENSNSGIDGLTYENGQMINGISSLPGFPTISSLCEVQGYIYAMAQDQNGCRFLQRIFDEGTSCDVQIIFNEIVNHVVELMLKPFGNYVIQKLLDVCNEEQRLQIVLMVTKEPGQLVGICLNTYGTRVIQKLIETLNTRQQISLVVLSLKPGFLDLIKDQNGNHVIQRCLQCLSTEDNKFIFDAAAKFCVEIATHRHGCCVMQRCIAHSTGKQREKLITEVSKNGLLLAQDPFGNYVVQYVIELKNTASIGYLLPQFKGHYVHLSMQKFSSHVVEKCLKHLEDSRSQIVHELLSVSHFEQLMQDPYANYVIQSALAVTKGPLHSALVQAVQPHMILRTSPYCKRIFSRNLLKK